MRLRKRLFVAAAAIVAAVCLARVSFQVPILMYHRIGDPLESGLAVSPETFERQMEFLKVHHYNVVSLSELVGRLRDGRPLPPKTVSITFDDGTIDNIEFAFPVLKKMNFPATVFMITENIGKPGWLSAEDLRLMDGFGVSVGSHTVSHAYLPDVKDDSEIRRQIVDSKRALEELLGHPVTLFSYPAGGFTETARRLVQEAGYEGAVTTNHGRRKDDVYALRRVKIKESGGSLFNFWLKTSGLYHLGKKRIQVGE
ncbi:MAG TPA: polysaccharide deacetylase family protein [Candidatus Eisenbacteria bacterium]|nr:polysaccharide deacetylase family protein [Candidatus Eisenbacteria bacterium]